MNVSKQEYSKMAENASPKSKHLRNSVLAFLVGGAICCFGQLLISLYTMWGMELKAARTLTSVTLIFLSGLFTALNLYPQLAKHAGAGTLVPITGFANSVVAPAIEFKSEGYITGLGAKIFTISGPVLVFGMIASVVYGIIYYAFTVLF